MKILLWATTLQADILSLALHLDSCDDVELMVVCEGLAAFRREPIAGARPLRCALLDRTDPDVARRCSAFGAEVCVFDNHPPPARLAPRLVSMWHGLGWKARGRADVRTFHREVERLTGQAPARPAPSFFAQCYHEADRRWRVEAWGLAAENCRVLGGAFTDLLLAPPYGREALAERYTIDVVGRRTVLLSFTWHYGRIFPGAWSPGGLLRASSPIEGDLAFLEALFAAIIDEGADVLFCMHDRKRYEAHYIDAIHALARRYAGRVQLKHKSDHPDNLADLVVADAMVTNLSSFITYFYVGGGPTVHLCPEPRQRDAIRLARLKRGKVAARTVERDEVLWMNAPEDNGGLTAYTADETLAAVRRAIVEPDCCRERARDWLARHVHGVDGRSGARFHDALQALVGD